MDSSQTLRQYSAFISYAHGDNREHGRRWAEWLHQTLEGYRIPKELIGRTGAHGQSIPRTLFPVFRDEEELAAADNLPSRIATALRQSAAMIVICSPRGARSTWVAREIEQFQALGKANRIFALIVDGEPLTAEAERECFPAPLRPLENGRAHPELIAADVRPEGHAGQGFTQASIWREALEQSDTGITRREMRHREQRYRQQLELASHKLVAGILGVELDALRRRSEVARSRRTRLLGVIAGGVALVTGVLALAAWQQSLRAERLRRMAEAERDRATQETRRAEEARSEAEGLIRWVQQDVRGSLLAAGRPDVLTELNRRIAAYFSSHPAAGGDEAGLAARAEEERLRGLEALRVKDVGQAEAAFRAETILRQQVQDLKPALETSILPLAESLRQQAALFLSTQRPAEAVPPLRAAIKLFEEAPVKDNGIAISSRSVCLVLLVQALNETGREAEAKAVTELALKAQEATFASLGNMTRNAAKTGDSDMAKVMGKLAPLFPRMQAFQRGALSPAEQRAVIRDTVAFLEEFTAAYEGMQAAQPDNVDVLSKLAAGFQGFTEKALENGWREEAIRSDRIQLHHSRNLVHAGSHRADFVLAHSERVRRHLGLLCANHLPPPDPPRISATLSAQEREVARLLCLEASQWLVGLPPAERAQTAWQTAHDQLEAWQTLLATPELVTK